MAKQEYKAPLTEDEYRMLLPRIGLNTYKIAGRLDVSETAVRAVLYGHPTTHVGEALVKRVHELIYNEILKSEKIVQAYIQDARLAA